MSEFVRDPLREEVIDRFVPYFGDKPEISEGEFSWLDGKFPAEVELIPGEFKPKIYVDHRTLNDLEADYCTDDLFRYKDLKTIYTEGGVVSAVLRNQIKPHDIAQLEEVHQMFNSPDSIMRQITEAGEYGRITEDEERTLLSALTEGWLTPDIARVNAMRLAIGIVCMMHGEKGKEMLRNLEEVTSKHLRSESLAGWTLYKETMGMFNGSIEAAAMQFSNTIPFIEVAGAFPMEESHIHQALNNIFSDLG